MDTVTATNQWAQLIKRRAEMALTLRHVELERRDIEAKETSMDRDARARRLTLLRDLNDWYAREIDQVDQELRRAGKYHLGTCGACGAPLSAATAVFSSEFNLCAHCQDYQKEL